MKEFLKGIREGWAKALHIPPVYADRPSDATLAEGWKTAYEQEKKRRKAAESRLALLDWLAYGMNHGSHANCGKNIRAILDMPEDKLNDGFGEN